MFLSYANRSCIVATHSEAINTSLGLIKGVMFRVSSQVTSLKIKQAAQEVYTFWEMRPDLFYDIVCIWALSQFISGSVLFH